jgi:hypothetical protein
VKPLDLNGGIFGRLRVLSKASSKSDGAIWWICRCDCGNIKEARGSDLKRGFISSCGCWKRDAPKLRTTHGGSDTRLYHIWQAMRNRTGNQNASKFHYYGGRGITVCDEWINSDSFPEFYSWAMSNGYQAHLTIDRIDNYKGYSPDNCRWATWTEQMNNKRPRNEIEDK